MLREVHKKIKHAQPRQKTLKVVPFFFTFANALLGLLAVLKAIDAEFIIAVYCILLAAFMDSLDGRLARRFNATSGLGAELDSLCDAISFCCAPAILLYSWGVSDFGILGLAVLGLYLCAGLFRLARFNIIAQHDDSFLGLPTPMAAFFLLSFIVYRDWFTEHAIGFIFSKSLFLLIILFIAFLMISTIKFPAFKHKSPRIKGLVLSGAIILFVLFIKQYPVLFIAPFLYIVSGLFYHTYLKIRDMVLALRP